MTDIAIGAIAGAGLAVLLAAVARGVEGWWLPRRRAALAMFVALKDVAYWSAILGFLCHEALIGQGRPRDWTARGVVTGIAAATAAWCACRVSVLLLVATRR